MTQPQADQRGSYILFFFVGSFRKGRKKEKKERKKERKRKDERPSQDNYVCVLNNTFSLERKKKD